MKVVFRIEHPDAALLGPFSKANPYRDSLSVYTKDNDLSEAYGDIIGFDCGRHICAVELLEHIHLWFGPFLAELHAVGFGLSAYEVPAVKLFYSRSQRQVAFDRDSAQLVARLSLDALPGLADCLAFDQELFAKYALSISA